MLDVFFEERLVGHLDRDRPLLSFVYDKGWLANNEAFPISLSMPLSAEPCPPEIVTPWFANLLPEERQLENLGRLLGRSKGDVYGLLEEVGGDTAGALSIGRPEPAEAGRYVELDDRALAEAMEKLPRHPLLAGEKDVTMSLAGAQSKLAVAMFDSRIHLPLRGAASTHILKPAAQRLYATVENELLCLRLAAAVGIPAAPVAMGITGDRRFLLVERYDRRLAGPRQVRRGHQEDFCQALGVYPTQKYERDGGPGLADLFAAVDRFSKAPAVDRVRLLDLVIFAGCIGDTDRHAKNYSFMLHPGRARLTPAYDLMTALAYEGITENIAMKVAGVRRPEFIERRHWERFAVSVGLSPAGTIRRVRELAGRVSDLAMPTAVAIAGSLPAEREALVLFAERISRRAAAVAAAGRRGPSEKQPNSARRSAAKPVR